MKSSTAAPFSTVAATDGEFLERIGRQLRLQTTALENAANAILVVDRQGMIVWVNPAFTTMTGYSDAEAIGRNPRFLKAHEHDRDFYAKLWNTILAGETWHGEFTNRRKNGTLYYSEHTIVPVRGADGAVAHFVAIMNDVTSRKRAESELRTAQVQMRQLQEYSPVITYRMEFNHGTVARLTVSDNVAQLLGFPAQTVSKYDWWLTQLHPADRERAAVDLHAPIAHEPRRTEYRLRHLDGGYRWIEDSRRVVRNAADKPMEFVGVWSDITERKRAEDVLRDTVAQHSGRQNKKIAIELGLMAAGTLLVFAGGYFYGWFERLIEILSDESAHPLFDETAGALAFIVLALVVFSFRRWRESRIEVISHRNMAAALGTLHAELENRVRQRTAELAGANESLRAEIAERRRTEDTLRLFRSLVDRSSDALEVIDPASGCFLDVNERSCTDLGYSRAEHLALTIFDIAPDIDPASWPARTANLRVAGTLNAETLHRRKDGSTFPVEFKATIVRLDREYVVTTVRDISTRKRMEEALRESQALYSSLVQQMPAGVFRKDAEGRYVFVNSWFCHLAGRPPGDFIGKRAEVIAREMAAQPKGDDRAAIVARGGVHHDEIMRTGARLDLEEEWPGVDGRLESLQVIKSPVFDAAGKVAGSQGILFDITPRKIAERELREQREQWRTLVTTSADAVFVVQDERIVLTNPAAVRLFGAPDSTGLLGRSIFDFVHEDFRGTVRSRIRQAYSQEDPLPIIEEKFLRLDASVVDVEASSVRFHFQGRAALLVDARDISERKRAETLLRETETRFRDLAENIREVFWLTTPALDEILYISPGYEKIWGRSCASLLASPRTWLDAIHPDDRGRVTQAVAKMASGLYDEEYRVVRPDGSVRWIRDRAFPVRSENNTLHRLAGLAEDITQPKQAALRLELQHAVIQVLAEAGSPEQAYRQILETVGRGLELDLGELWMVDRSAKILRCAEVWHLPSSEVRAFVIPRRELTFGPGAGLPGGVWAAGQAKWIPDISGDPACLECLQAGSPVLRSWIGFPIKLRSEILGVIGFFSTKTSQPDPETIATLTTLGFQLGQFIERQQLAEQFREAQKMEAIGTLAGGIAHDFNNILAAITGFTELARIELGPNSSVSEHLDSVLAGGARATALVRQILAFSRQQEHERRSIQLRHIVREAMNLLRATIPTTITFEPDFASELPPVLADPTQVHQVVMNLCTNAWHAMRDGTGRLGVTLEPYSVDADLAEQHVGLRAGNYVRLSVSDTGHGMDRATIARIFEPFFTTKGPGEGTGLGLAVVHGIMKSHEGAVTVYSQPGEGTVFRLYFPACTEETAEAKIDGTHIPQGHGERVLYVDDEEPLARMGSKILERLGYVVVAQTNPDAVLAAVRADPELYDLVITDLTMPAMTGTQLAKELLSIRPNLPIILTTGYTATLTPARVRAMGIRDLISKPVSVHALGTAAARVLAANHHGELCPES